MSLTITSEVKEAPPREHSGEKLRSLDGLRAVSILLVLLGHVAGTRGFWSGKLGIGDYAHLGVVVFFVISGFLITSLLVSEHRRNGRVSLKLFYARRALRIFPASYAYLAVLAVLWACGLLPLTPRDLSHAVTYTVNHQPDVSWYTGHLWSLSVEEQFYLLWPFTFVVLGPRKAIVAAAAVVLLAPVARSLGWLFLRGTPYYGLQMFPMVADSLAVGCLLATTRGWLERQRWYLWLFHPLPSMAVLTTILTLNSLMGFTVVNVFGASVINLGIAVLIHRSVHRSTDTIGQVLNWRPVAFVGLLSYSLYLWQQLFLNRNSTGWIHAFPQNLLFAVGAALLSYLLLERPLLRWRQRLRT